MLLLDLDDTLTDRRASFRAWALAFCAAHGLPDDAASRLEDLDAGGFTPRPEFFAQTVERFTLTGACAADLLARFQRDFATYKRVPPNGRWPFWTRLCASMTATLTAKFIPPGVLTTEDASDLVARRADRESVAR